MSRNFLLMKQLREEKQLVDVDVQIPRRETEKTEGFVSIPGNGEHSDNVLNEEMLRLVRRVFLSSEGDVPRVVVFCSVEGDSGSSLISVRAAKALAAQSSRSVCLIDANLLSPRISDFFMVDTTTPFSGTFDALREQCVKAGSNLWVAGPEIFVDDRRQLLSPEGLKKRVAELRSMFSYVLIDIATVTVEHDEQLLGKLSDAVILVVEASRTRRQAAQAAKDMFEAADVRVLGSVLNNQSFPVPEKIYKKL
jgi:Mrp family chromosome partitioning ATPase